MFEYIFGMNQHLQIERILNSFHIKRTGHLYIVCHPVYTDVFRICISKKETENYQIIKKYKIQNKLTMFFNILRLLLNEHELILDSCYYPYKKEIFWYNIEYDYIYQYINYTKYYLSDDYKEYLYDISSSSSSTNNNLPEPISISS